MKDQGKEKKTVLEEKDRPLCMVTFSPGAHKTIESKIHM